MEPEAHGQFALAAARNAKTMEKGGKSAQAGSFIPNCELWCFSQPRVRPVAMAYLHCGECTISPARSAARVTFAENEMGTVLTFFA